MAHPYTTRARLDALMGPERLAYLLDIDRDGTEDAGVFADTIERAANLTDAALGACNYPTPFNAITDTTPTPGIVSDYCDYLAAEMFSAYGGSPAADDAKWYAARADALRRDIASGRMVIPGVAITDGTRGSPSAAFGGAAPTFGGIDSYGTPRTRGLF